VSLAVSTATEQDYVIAPRSVTEELLERLRGLVRIQGVVSGSENGDPTLEVEKFEALGMPRSWSDWDVE